uniref:hypothetical protein n=1 Tax=Ileibacterium valens TaxID=1862668 RepID=UPI00322052B8
AKVARINPGYNMHFFGGLHQSRDNFIKLTRCSSPEVYLDNGCYLIVFNAIICLHNLIYLLGCNKSIEATED